MESVATARFVPESFLSHIPIGKQVSEPSGTLCSHRSLFCALSLLTRPGSVAGRNTPSSQVTDEPDTAAAPGGGAREPPARDGPQRSPAHGAATGSKPPATVIEDKFGKFSIKPLNEGERCARTSRLTVSV